MRNTITEGHGQQWEDLARNLKSYTTGEEILCAFFKTLVAGETFFLALSDGKLRAYYTAWREYWRLAGLSHLDFIICTYERNTSGE